MGAAASGAPATNARGGEIASPPGRPGQGTGHQQKEARRCDSRRLDDAIPDRAAAAFGNDG
jgi:hypothetical protein